MIQTHVKIWEALSKNIFWKEKENSSWLSLFAYVILTTLLSCLPLFSFILVWILTVQAAWKMC